MSRRSGDAAKAEFGVSTHLFHEHRLTRDHLVHIAAHGFESVELFATRAHFDYHDDLARVQLAEWLSDTRLELHSVHAPAFAALRQGRWVGALSNASSDESRRRAAIAEAEAALALARDVPFRYLVTHIGVPMTAGQLRLATLRAAETVEADDEVDDLPDEPEPEPAAEPVMAGAARRAAKRASVPTWDEIMFGRRRSRD